MKNVKKHLNVAKTRTATARRISRLIKSIQTGHLTGFVHKLVLTSPIVRFLVAVLAMICLIIAAMKIWLAVRVEE